MIKKILSDFYLINQFVCYYLELLLLLQLKRKQIKMNINNKIKRSLQLSNDNWQFIDLILLK